MFKIKNNKKITLFYII